MFGEPENQFSLTRGTLGTRGAQKHIFIKQLRSTAALACLSALALHCLPTYAGTLSLPMVPVGNPGNNADQEFFVGWGRYGAVDYSYSIGRYEVTAGQYTAFLNAVGGVDTYGIYSPEMWTSNLGCKIERYAGLGTAASPWRYRVASVRANRPVNYVNFWDACRFANWLNNGQPTGPQTATTTERGAYTLDGYNDLDGRAIGRSPGAQWALPSEDEWYKAAYHKNDGATANYSAYPTCSDTVPSNALIDPDPGNNATRYDNNGYTIGAPYYRTEVGAHENSESPYGTFDQGGNVREWNEAVFDTGESYSARGLRGGSFSPDPRIDPLHAMIRDSYPPILDFHSVGFRIVQVPQPCSALLFVAGALVLLRRAEKTPR